MIDKGYLVLSHGNTYDFYEVPQVRSIRSMNNTRLDNDFENDEPRAVDGVTDAVKSCPAEDREINNSENSINNENTNIDFPSRIEAPKVKEIVIKSPKPEGRSRPPAQENKPSVFDF